MVEAANAGSRSLAELPDPLIARPEFEDAIGHLFERLAFGQFAAGINLVGARGVGKTVSTKVALRRARDDYAAFSPLVRLGARRTSLVLATLEAVQREHDRFFSENAPALKATRSYDVKITAALPILPVNIELDPRRVTPDERSSAIDLVHEYIRNLSSTGRPVLFVVDEADMLTKDDYQDLIVPMLEEAMEGDLGVSVLTAGTGREHIRSIQDIGAATFVPTLSEQLLLKRLSLESGLKYLNDVATSFHLDWSSHDLSDVVVACQGLPRALHVASEQLRKVLVDSVTVELVGQKIVEQIAHTRTLIAPKDERFALALTELLSIYPEYSLETELISGLRHVLPDLEYTEIHKNLDAFERFGMIERIEPSRICRLF